MLDENRSYERQSERKNLTNDTFKFVFLSPLLIIIKKLAYKL
jgi:hypothetical protein